MKYIAADNMKFGWFISDFGLNYRIPTILDISNEKWRLPLPPILE